MASAGCLINNLIGSIYGFSEDWAVHQPVCISRAYIYTLSCGIICFSYTAHAIGRLFSTIYYKQKYLLTYRVHWFMITVGWTLAILLTGAPIFFDNPYVYQKESRLCILPSQRFGGSIFVMSTEFAIPLGCTVTIYSIIFRHARSSGRVVPIVSNNTNSAIPNMKRELKVARNMMIIVIIFAFGGSPYLALAFWNRLGSPSSIPEPLYPLVLQAITLSVTLQMYVLFRSSKQIKHIAEQYLRLSHEVGQPISHRKNPRILQIKL